MKIETEKKFAAGLSIFSNSSIIVLKIIAGILSGSISIISEAVHSISDCIASVLTFFAVSKSNIPADKEHPFGHGKYEDMSGFLEGCLILFAGLYIIYEAIARIIYANNIKTEPIIGIYVMTISIIANIIVSRYLFKIAKKTESVSLYADGEHLRTDIFSSAGVLFGLVLIKITGVTALDSIVAIIVALVIIKTGYKITKDTLNDLLDGSLPEEDIKAIKSILMNNKDIKGYKEIKARKSGPFKDIEITVFFDGNTQLYKCHDICDEIELEITKIYNNSNIIIHTEPISNKPEISTNK